MKVLYIIVAILILLLMITIHEFGHYLAGKILGFKIDEFSIGFGPKLFSKKKKNGEVFSIRLLPLGGYCAFAGETDEEAILAPEKMNGKKGDGGENGQNGQNAEVFDLSDAPAANGTDVRPVESEHCGNAPTSGTQDGRVEAGGESQIRQDERTESNDESKMSRDGSVEAGGESEVRPAKKFNEQPPWKRIIVLMAGGVFNLLSAVIFSILFIAVAGSSTPTIEKVYDSVPEQSGYVCNLMAGDTIVSIDGTKIDFYHTIQKALEGKTEGDTIQMVVLRDGKEEQITTCLRRYVVENADPQVGMGVGLRYEKASVGEAFLYCVPYTAELSWVILGTFGKLIIGQVPLNQVSGTIGTINQIADLGMQNGLYFLVLLPLIAANLGIFNLFPIPALDGSKVVFTIIEWIRGKPINQKVESMIHFVGLIVLLGFVVILDLVNLIMGAI